jgi:hypothetical protein
MQCTGYYVQARKFGEIRTQSLKDGRSLLYYLEEENIEGPNF